MINKLFCACLQHMQNYNLLLQKISKWMSQDGLLFINHVCHKTFAYQYEVSYTTDCFVMLEYYGFFFIRSNHNYVKYFLHFFYLNSHIKMQPVDDDDWLTNYAFSKEAMLIPSASFLLYFQVRRNALEIFCSNMC